MVENENKLCPSQTKQFWISGEITRNLTKKEWGFVGSCSPQKTSKCDRKKSATKTQKNDSQKKISHIVAAIDSILIFLLEVRTLFLILWKIEITEVFWNQNVSRNNKKSYRSQISASVHSNWIRKPKHFPFATWIFSPDVQSNSFLLKKSRKNTEISRSRTKSKVFWSKSQNIDGKMNLRFAWARC